MYMKYKELKYMCEEFPTEYNLGYILALKHNELITLEQYNDLYETITESNYYREE